ncbi:hypothetical protein FRB95_005354 [Tulasnella sp. JGI-2019a]|nr:hypothetical protein FRB93_005335 [Tulasnella sp. JGI-2019a]KAG9029399.1 hypothetical protein FRB95_005354 [Tulasnella sp. JGI-2019a]
MPRRGGLPSKRPIPNVKRVVAVASGKGGVGKSTIAVNLAISLAQNPPAGFKRAPRVGLLDLDIFGPSVPKLMGLEGLPPPELTNKGAIIPYANHGLQCMSMGFLLRPSAASLAQGGSDTSDTAVVWRGLMVQKAAQQLLFDVDWRGKNGEEEGLPGLDILVIDMPPGTGDVQLTLGQLVEVDGAVIVSTPQDVALIDARKGVSMFRKVEVPILGLLLNMAHFICSSCDTKHQIFGSPEPFHNAAASLSLPVLGELPMVPTVSTDGDTGRPTALRSLAGRDGIDSGVGGGAVKVKAVMENVARIVWEGIVDTRKPV